MLKKDWLKVLYFGFVLWNVFKNTQLNPDRKIVKWNKRVVLVIKDILHKAQPLYALVAIVQGFIFRPLK